MLTNANSTPSHVQVLVIGGGINGVGIARDAAGRGLSVALCEKSDLGGATSSSSSKLIHGGLRYLEQYEFRLVREALAEREVLLANSPHIMWPLRFRLPHQKHLRPAWMIRIGLFLYDSLAKRTFLPASTTLSVGSSSPLASGISTCFEYSDGWVDDARLVILNALSAQQKGAHIMPQTECLSAERSENGWKVSLRGSDGKTFSLSADVLVNAGGPWALSVIERMQGVENPKSMRLVKGSHIIVPRLYDSEEAYILQNSDGRIVFVIPYEQQFSLVGTTDEDYVGDPAQASISESETQYLVSIVNQYFKRQITTGDIVHSYSGVRPLLEEKNASAQELTRDYKLELDIGIKGAPLLNIFGGKITTYRKLAEQAVNKLMPLFCTVKHARPWTSTEPLPGGDFENQQTLALKMQQKCSWLPSTLCERWARQYGTLAFTFINTLSSPSDMGECFGADLFEMEVNYLITHEWARTSDDILWRRTKCGLVFTDSEKARLHDYLLRKTKRLAA